MSSELKSVMWVCKGKVKGGARQLKHKTQVIAGRQNTVATHLCHIIVCWGAFNGSGRRTLTRCQNTCRHNTLALFPSLCLLATPWSNTFMHIYVINLTLSRETFFRMHESASFKQQPWEMLAYYERKRERAEEDWSSNRLPLALQLVINHDVEQLLQQRIQINRMRHER